MVQELENDELRYEIIIGMLQQSPALEARVIDFLYRNEHEV